MSVARYGASPAEWRHFVDIGYLADLLPVVSSPHAVMLAAETALTEPGKVPSRYNAAGRLIGIPQWTKHQTCQADIDRWSEQSDYGICLQTRRVKAIDIDVDDEVEAGEIREVIEGFLAGHGIQDCPVRYRKGTPRKIYVVFMPAELSKLAFPTKSGGLLELLGTGQQFVAIGQHKSGTRYEWRTELPPKFPAVSKDLLLELWELLKVRFARVQVGDNLDRINNGGVPPVGVSVQALADIVAAIPPVGSYADWLAVGMALHHETDGSMEGLDLWDDFSQRGEYEGRRVLESRWEGFGRYRGAIVTLGRLRQLAGLEAVTPVSAFRSYGEAPGAAIAGPVVPFVAPVQAVARTEAPPPPAFLRNNHGQVLPTRHNLALAIGYPIACGYHVKYDSFNGGIVVLPLTEKPGAVHTWLPMTDVISNSMILKLERPHSQQGSDFMPIGKSDFADMLGQVANDNAVDAARDWIKTLPEHDGVPRVDTLFSRYFGCDDNEYTRAVGRYLTTAIVARALHPGCQADMAPILTGKQGTGKSTSIKALVPGGMCRAIDLRLSYADLCRKLRGTLLGELPELSGMRARDVDQVKMFLTERQDNFTNKYEAYESRSPRRAIFIGSTNDEEFLRDDTGERRWLPMSVVNQCEPKLIERDRDQIFAEALVLYCLAGGIEWEDAQRLAPEVTALHKENAPRNDLWLTLIREWLSGAGRFTAPDGARQGRWLEQIPLKDVLTGAVGMAAERLDLKAAVRASRIMKQLGFVKRHTEEGNIWSMPVTRPSDLF